MLSKLKLLPSGRLPLGNLPDGFFALLGVILIAAGLYLKANVRVSFPWLTPLGIPSHTFASSDYFPLLPNLGYFLLGSVVGRLFYQDRTTKFPRVNENILPLRFLRFCGKHSLIIYLVHQPVLYGLGMAWYYLK